MVAPGTPVAVAIPVARVTPDLARDEVKTGDFGRFGRRRHANQLFWHVFGLLAG